jgi:uncharacterized protein
MAKISLLPRENKFYELFMEGARNTVEVALALQQMLAHWDKAKEGMLRINELEHAGDNITHSIMDMLNRSFVTPIDREDIGQLAHIMDDVTDYIHAAAEAMTIYRTAQPTKRSQQLAQILVDAAHEIEQAVGILQKGSNLKSILTYCVDINRLENEADEISRQALGELFTEKIDDVDIIKWREIYQHLEKATDRCEDVANILEGIVIKNG